MPDRSQKPGPEKVAEEDVGDPERMVNAIVRKALLDHRAPADQLEALNRHLDAFAAQLGKVPAHLRNQDPGSQFVEKAMGLLQKEIEKRDVQGRLVT